MKHSVVEGKRPRINFKLLLSDGNEEKKEKYLERLYKVYIKTYSEKTLLHLQNVSIPIPKKYRVKLIRYCEFGLRMFDRHIRGLERLRKLHAESPELLQKSTLFKKEYLFFNRPELKEELDSKLNYYSEGIKWIQSHISFLFEHFQDGPEKTGRIQEWEKRLEEDQGSFQQYSSWMSKFEQGRLDELTLDETFMKRHWFALEVRLHEFPNEVKKDIEQDQLIKKMLEAHYSDLLKGKLRIFRLFLDWRTIDNLEN